MQGGQGNNITQTKINHPHAKHRGQATRCKRKKKKKGNPPPMQMRGGQGNHEKKI